MSAPASVGKYPIERLLKHGGMGSLYLGFDPDLKRSVAIKLLRGDLDHDALRKRFQREIAAVAGLRHRNIVTIFETGMHEGEPYLVMEFIPGENLGELIRRQPPLSVERKLQIVEDICAALGHAHASGIIHRDVKPANIMIDDDDSVKVVDFGIARMRDSDLTTDGAIIGTLSYMAPEQMSGGPVDHRADVFAAGAVMYELLSYTRAFQGGVGDGVIAKVLFADPPPLPGLCPELPLDICAIAARAMDKDPDRRFQDARTMRAAVAAARQRFERAHVVADPVPPSMDPTVRVPPRSDQVSREPSAGPAAAVLSAGIEERLDSARRAMTTGEFERATRICQDVLHVAPDNSDARTLLAEARESDAALRSALAAPAAGSLTAIRLVHWVALVLLLIAGAGVWLAVPGDWPSPPDEPPLTTVTNLPVPPAPRVPAPEGIPTPPESGTPKPSPVPPIPSPTPRTAPDDVRTTGTPPSGLTAVRRPEGAGPPDVTPTPAPSPDVTPTPAPAPDVTPIPAPPPAPTPTPVPGPVASPLPPPVAQTDRQQIQAVLDRYAAAMTKRSMADIAAVFPMMTGDAAAQLQNSFNDVRAWQVTLTASSVKLQPDGLAAEVVATIRYDDMETLRRPGQRVRSTASVNLQMRKTNGQWLIAGLTVRAR